MEFRITIHVIPIIYAFIFMLIFLVYFLKRRDFNTILSVAPPVNISTFLTGKAKYFVQSRIFQFFYYEVMWVITQKKHLNGSLSTS